MVEIVHGPIPVLHGRPVKLLGVADIFGQGDKLEAEGLHRFKAELELLIGPLHGEKFRLHLLEQLRRVAVGVVIEQYIVVAHAQAQKELDLHDPADVVVVVVAVARAPVDPGGLQQPLLLQPQDGGPGDAAALADLADGK